MFGQILRMSLRIPENLIELGENFREAAIVSATSANLPKLAEILTRHSQMIQLSIVEDFWRLFKMTRCYQEVKN